jgi:hypothetical protein
MTEQQNFGFDAGFLQREKQCRGCADGVSVRADVGSDQDTFARRENVDDLLVLVGGHRM